MLFTSDDIHKLVAGWRDYIHVGSFNDVLLARLRWQLGLIFLSRDSVIHIREKHPDITNNDLLWIPQAIEYGMVIRDERKLNLASVCFSPKDHSLRYRIILKRVRSEGEVFVASMHRMRHRQTKGMLTHGTLVRRHRML